MGEILGGAGLGVIGQVMQNQANASQVTNQEEYQTQMANTAYQRQVSDMKAAGLNPMFAIGSGGASAPSGSVAQQGNVVQSGMQNAQAVQGVQNAAASQNNQNMTTKADIALKGAQALQSAAQTKNLGLDSKLKSTVGKVSDAAGDVVDAAVKGYEKLGDVTGLRSLFQSGAVKKPIQYGTPSP